MSDYYGPPQPPAYGPHGEPHYPDYGQAQYPDYGQPQYPPPYPPQYPPRYPARRSRRPLWIVLAVVVLAALGVGAFFLFSGGGSTTAHSPRAAVSKLLDADSNDDAEATKQALCQADANDTVVARLRSAGRVTSYTIDTVRTVSAEAALVRTTLTTSVESNPFPTEFRVIKEDGSWKVCPDAPLPGQSTSSTGSSAAPSTPSQLSPSLPTGAPPNLGGLSNPCSFASEPLTAATIYVGLAEINEVDYAQACVYPNTVPRSTTASLGGSGTLYEADPQSTTSPITFTSSDGTTTLEITVTKESDGVYYVTKVVKR